MKHLFLRFLLLTLTSLPFTALLGQEDDRPVVVDTAVPKEEAVGNGLPTLYLVGDSTMKSDAPLRGWAQEIGIYFDPTKINVVNRAIGGRSSRTFQAEGKWDGVLKDMKAGDFMMVQFGHNDVGPLDERGKFRGSVKGEDEKTENVTKPDGTVETVHTFGWYMRKFGTDTKAKGATAIFCSMIPHKNWAGNKIARGERQSFVKWTAHAAKQTGAAFIDLNEIVAHGYEKLGKPKVESLFADKGTHTSVEGAQYNAAAVISGLKALKPNPLANYFSAQANSVPATTVTTQF